MLKINTQDNYELNSEKWVGANSLGLNGQHFLARAGNVISKALTASRIIWVNYTESDFASDNQTGAKDTVRFEPKVTGTSYNVTIAGGTVTIADEGKFFSITNSETVDGTTVNAAPTGLQLEMVEFISATEGVFKIINL